MQNVLPIAAAAGLLYLLTRKRGDASQPPPVAPDPAPGGMPATEATPGTLPAGGLPAVPTDSTDPAPAAPALLVNLGYTAGPYTTRNFQKDWNRVVNYINSAPYLADALGWVGASFSTLARDNAYGPKTQAAAEYVQAQYGTPAAQWFDAVSVATAEGASDAP
jgi:hypothetical protein